MTWTRSESRQSCGRLLQYRRLALGGSATGSGSGATSVSYRKAGLVMMTFGKVWRRRGQGWLIHETYGTSFYPRKESLS